MSSFSFKCKVNVAGRDVNLEPVVFFSKQQKPACEDSSLEP